MNGWQEERGLEQAAHGVYVSPDTWTDAMYILHLHCNQAVFSHETALFFHDLTDREPLKYTITVRTGYNPSRLQEDGFQVYTIKKELHEIGITTMQTSFGHAVPVYNMERTICDLVEDVEMIISQTISTPLDDGVSFRVKRISEIMEEADYPGVHVSMETKFDGVITPLKIDISTGDVITPRRVG